MSDYPKDLKPETVNETEVEIQKLGKERYKGSWDGKHGEFRSTAGSKERFVEILKMHRGDDL